MTESQVVEAPEGVDESESVEEPQPSSTLEGYVRDALHGAGMKVSDLTDVQRERAESAPEVKAGLRDKALASYVLNGKEPKKPEPKPRKPRAPSTRTNTKYPDEIMGAVARARVLSEAKDPDKKARGEHIGYAGPKQHVAVREYMTGLIENAGGTVSKESVLEASGIKSMKQMRDIATFKADREVMKPLREHGKAFGKDGWAKGRYLAAILCAWLEDLDTPAA